VSPLDGLAAPEDEAPLPFDVWSALSARLSACSAEERLGALAEAEIAPEAWERADGHWSLVLTSEAARGELGRAEAFGRVCVEARRAAAPRGTRRAALEPVAPPLSEPSPPAVTAVPSQAVPTYLRSDPIEPPSGSQWAPGRGRGGAPSVEVSLAVEAGYAAAVTRDHAPFAPPLPDMPFVTGVSPLAVPGASAVADAHRSGDTVILAPLQACPASVQVSPPFASPPESRGPMGTAVLDPDHLVSILSAPAAPKR
jgi:hypothetical protein